jgi:hypothetical protein
VAQLEALCALVADGLTPASAAELVRGGAEQTPQEGGAGSRTRPPEAEDRASVRGMMSAVLRLTPRR